MARVFALAAAAASFYQLALGQNTNCTAVGSGQTYDYIVIGSGAGGIPIADRLSEAGHSVLLLEKGPPSSGRWNGTMKPTWLEGTNLTRFDVPGLFNQIWHDPTGVACEDIDVMGGCVLGGGIAVNSALWWKPHPRDWDINFPTGWKNSDMQNDTDKVFQRIPGTYIPSMDGKLYLQQGFDRVSKGLDAAGFKQVVPNDHADQKNHTYGHSTFFIENAERHGPLRTYLVTASQRKQFSLWTNTVARRLVRTGGHVTGVELECNKGGSVGPGHSGIVNVTPGTGRVIVSAGTFGSAKLLFRSGIGPTDQLTIVKNSATDGATMISSDQWINLPVGYNLNDHVAPNLGPIIWQQIKGTDGVYLGAGTISRGRMTITPQLTTRVSTPPYLRDQYDKEAVIQGIEYMKGVLSQIPSLTWIAPTASQNTTAFVNSIPATPGSRGSNHWTGSCTIGTDDGRTGGNAVVDLDTKVYGTDNLFVVDASIFPGMTTGNPSAAIIIASEHAAERILALKTPAHVKTL
ncbi:FAD/NAD(P)-binding domain-containing protein [Lindgomyces ingoldianus]|uniref:FAD/NAD(P)-binding domain-containing protein n=1 Tax=Lindgomyces ingoldianus TaxID=673940 RepID=A0ACB6QAD7_9PLEO|nr:FAD/NAD(P)-binding domain-containing protein [Lindgomyces ingoldianus]KAF2463115.1 FAD/NAD(P)-binding domain-containing protein [Lindgomyces ingoldianus]